MTSRSRLRSRLTVYRIGDARGKFPVYSSEGARRDDRGRWHVKGDRVIYAAEHFSTAMLEKLVHWSGSPPGNQRYVEVTIPANTSFEASAGGLPSGVHQGSFGRARR